MKVTLLGVGGLPALPQIGGADGFGDWGELDPAEPRNRRTRSSIVIETDDQQRRLVDTPPDLRLQLTNTGIGRIDAVLYTHAHADHIAGLDEIRILNRIIGRAMPAYVMRGIWAGTPAALRLCLQAFPWRVFLPAGAGGRGNCSRPDRADFGPDCCG